MTKIPPRRPGLWGGVWRKVGGRGGQRATPALQPREGILPAPEGGWKVTPGSGEPTGGWQGPELRTTKPAAIPTCRARADGPGWFTSSSLGIG